MSATASVKTRRSRPLRGSERRHDIGRVGRLGGADVPGSGAFGRLLFVEAHALAFFEILEAAALHRAAVEKPLLTALVANEPESLFPRQTFDRAARHDVSLSAGPNDPFGLYTVSANPALPLPRRRWHECALGGLLARN